MSQFRVAYPGVTLKLHDAISDRCFEMLMEGYADICVTAQAGEGREFESAPLFNEPFYLLCLKDDPLARLKSLRLSHLKGREYIDVRGKGEVWEQRKRDLRDAGVRETGLHVANFGTLVGLIVAGFGVGLVPRMALPLCQRDELIEKPIKDSNFVRTFYLVKRRNRSLSIAAERMARFLTESVGGPSRSDR